MDEETRSFKFVSTNITIWTAQFRTYRWFANQYSTDESRKNNVPGINTKTYTITPDSLFVGFSNPKHSIFTGCLPPLSFCAKPKVKSQNPQTWMNSNTPGEVRPSIKIGDGRGRTLSQTPHLPCQASSSQRRRFSFDFWNSGFCNSGQALRAEWHESEMDEWYKSEKAEWMN